MSPDFPHGDRWVDGHVEIVKALKGVSVDSPAQVKLKAVEDLAESLGLSPDVVGQCWWEDVSLTDDPGLRERVADMLAENDAAGGGPVSRGEYLADADALLSLVGSRETELAEALRDLVAARDRGDLTYSEINSHEEDRAIDAVLRRARTVLEGVERTHAPVPNWASAQAAEWLSHLAADFNHGLNVPTGRAIRALARAFEQAARDEQPEWPKP